MRAWPPRDWRALLALIFSVIGCVVQTVFVWWGTYQLTPGQGWSAETELHRADTARWNLWIASASILIVLTGLGMVINRRSLKGKVGDNSFEYEGGDAALPIERAIESTLEATPASTPERFDPNNLPHP